MTKEVFEDMQPGAAGGAKAKLEKQARQLAYDTKYKVKQAMAAKSGGKMDPAAVSKAYLAQLAKSPAPPAVKMLAKKKLIGEDVVNIKQLVSSTLVGAIVKEFTSEKTEEVVQEETKGDQKFHIKVRDKKTGNTYHRYATRAKIAELRGNPNIATVEMSHQGEEGTKAKKDHDGDGKVETPSKEHAGAVHNAIQKAKGGTPDGQDTRKEEVETIAERGPAVGGKRKPGALAARRAELDKMAAANQEDKKKEVEISEEESKIGGGNLKKLSKKATKRIDADVDGDVDTDDMNSSEMGEFVPSPDGKKKIKTKVQKEEFSNWRDDLFEKKDENGDEEVDIMKGKNTIKVMPKLGESAEVCEKCGKSPCECKEEDPRGMRTKVNLMRNKLRAMGLKMSHEPEGEMVEQAEEGQGQAPSADEKQMIAKKRQMLQKTQMLQKQKLNLQKQGKLPITSEEVENINEEDYDRMKDRRMERGGVGANVDYSRPPAAPNLAGKKKPMKGGPSAIDIVKAQIRAKHGKGAIMDTKKK